MPQVSVIIPTYNRAQYVCEAIDSVLAQTYRDLEIIVVDDGSTDNTREVLGKYDDQVRYIYRENGGPSAARNTGLGHARGEYIAFLDSDDLFLPGKLEVQLKGFDQFPKVGMVYSKSLPFHSTFNIADRCLDSVGHITFQIHDIFEDMLLLRKGPNTIEPLVRRDCFSQVGNFDEQLVVGEDSNMWLRVIAHYPVAFANTIVARYRQHSEQASKTGLLLGKYIRAYHYTLEKIAADLPPMRQSPRVCECIRRARALVGILRACYTFLAEDKPRGIQHLCLALEAGELCNEDAEQVVQRALTYGNIFDAGDPLFTKSTDLLHAMWDSRPQQDRYLGKHLRNHLAHRHRQRARRFLERGERLTSVLEAMSWLRYREPWKVPNFVKRALAGAHGGARGNHAYG